MSNEGSASQESSMHEFITELPKKEEESEAEIHFFSLALIKENIPFLLYTKQGKLFTGKGMVKHDCLLSSFFTIKSLDIVRGCATLTILEPVDIDGCRVRLFSEVFSLLTTNFCLTVDLNQFCAVQCLSSKLVDRPLPVIEPKDK